MPDELPHGMSAAEVAQARICLQCRVVAVPCGEGWVHPAALREKFARTGVCDAPVPGAEPKEREIRFGRGKAPGERHSISGTLDIGWRPGQPVVIGTDGSYKMQVVNGRVRKFVGWAYIATTGAYGAGSSAPSTATVGRERVLVGELRAVYWALKAVPEDVDVQILIDSAYAIEWLRRWRAGDTALPHGYSQERAEGRTPRLMELSRMIRDAERAIEPVWVPGHRGVPLNEGADALARMCRAWSGGRISKQVLRTDAMHAALNALTRHFEETVGTKTR